MRAYYISIALLGTTVVVLGAVFFVSGVSESPKTLTEFTPTDSAGVVRVRITERGFEPKIVRVQAGTTVLWQNEGEKKHWPAGNDHPTHQEYPQKSAQDCAGSSFDTCHALERGESWSFKFSQTGSWSYHDHLFPALTGSVLVGEMPVKKITALSALKEFFKLSPSCPSSGEFKEMTGSAREEIIVGLAQKSTAKAWACLKSVAISKGAVILNVHDLAHIIGNAAYKQNGLKGVSACDSAFAYGCFHGVTEQLLLEEGPESVEQIAKECRILFPAGNPQADNYTGCLHGMGHGLLSYENLDLPRALSWCQKLAKNDQQFCFDGVFMEYAGSAAEQTMRENSPWAICEGLGEEFHIACARYQPNLWQNAFGWNTEKSAKACVRGNTPTLRDNCLDSVGFIIAQRHPGDKEKILAGCSPIESYEYKAKCLTATALENKFQRYTGWEEFSKEICQSLAKPWDAYCTLRLSRVNIQK